MSSLCRNLEGLIKASHLKAIKKSVAVGTLRVKVFRVLNYLADFKNTDSVFVNEQHRLLRGRSRIRKKSMWGNISSYNPPQHQQKRILMAHTHVQPIAHLQYVAFK